MSIEHLKKPKGNPAWKRFFGLRQWGWDTENISNDKIVYAALDATMAIVIFYNVLVHWTSAYKKGEYLDNDDVSWEAFLSRVLKPLVDRECSTLYETERDLLMHSAALNQSIPVIEEMPINLEEDSSNRRDRMMLTIKERYSAIKGQKRGASGQSRKKQKKAKFSSESRLQNWRDFE